MTEKFTCPYCKAKYELDVQTIADYRGKTLECETCGKKFTIDEAVKCVTALLGILKTEAEVEHMKQRLDALQQHIERAKTDPNYDAYNGAYENPLIGYGVDEDNPKEDLASAKSDITDAKAAVKDAKEEYAEAKKEAPGETMARCEVFETIGHLFQEGKLTAPLDNEFVEYAIRVISKGNAKNLIAMLKVRGMMIN